MLLLVGLLVAMVAGGVHWSQTLPNMTVSGDKVEIVNCGEYRPKYSTSVCPKLFCKKEIYEKGLAPTDAEIRFVKSKRSDEPVGEFIQGAFRI